MRVAHCTDIHWQVAPGLGDATIKRILGTANLYLAGRRHHFSPVVQDALMAHLQVLDLDLLLITGDLTAQALDSEFATARRALQPVLDTVPTFVIPGNHDVYTPGAQRSQRIRTHFGPYMGLDAGAVTRRDCGSVTALGLDPNRPTWILASGELPQAQLDALAQTLEDPSLADQFVILCIHYPILDRHGEVYDGPKHGLLNARALIDVLRNATHTPDLILCGHEHHGFRTELDLGERSVPLINSGSSGYAFMPEKRRAAAMNVYALDGGALAGVERFLYTEQGFQPEPGGAYATGR